MKARRYKPKIRRVHSRADERDKAAVGRRFRDVPACPYRLPTRVRSDKDDQFPYNRNDENLKIIRRSIARVSRNA